MMQRKRETARWIFSKELKDTTVVEETKEGEGRPYIITPLGTRIKRILLCGSVTSRNVEENMTRLTVADPTGSFYLSIFQSEYTPEVKASADTLENNSMVLVYGRINPFKTNEGALYFSVNPEMIIRADSGALNYWSIRTAHLTRRKIYAIREAKKNGAGDIENLVKLGYSRDEAESAINSLKHYGNYNVEAFLEALSMAEKSLVSGGKNAEVRDYILGIIAENSSDGKGCRYEDIVEAASKKDIDQSTVDEVLNILGSDGEIFEVSLKRYKVI
ncbi:MAG: hypothetical protein M1315_01205 [Candidatus Thermoplasmatota archaeon]|nr:hypothetical protein [Candidatus Thermoplasmatota archaeon]